MGMGQVLAGTERLIFINELVLEKLDELPEQLAKVIPPPPAPPPPVERLSIKEWLLIAYIAVMSIGVLTGRISPEVVALLAR